MGSRGPSTALDRRRKAAVVNALSVAAASILAANVTATGRLEAVAGVAGGVVNIPTRTRGREGKSLFVGGNPGNGFL